MLIPGIVTALQSYPAGQRRTETALHCSVRSRTANGFDSHIATRLGGIAAQCVAFTPARSVSQTCPPTIVEYDVKFEYDRPGLCGGMQRKRWPMTSEVAVPGAPGTKQS